jgi:hypothetical protein
METIANEQARAFSPIGSWVRDASETVVNAIIIDWEAF